MGPLVPKLGASESGTCHLLSCSRFLKVTREGERNAFEIAVLIFFRRI